MKTFLLLLLFPFFGTAADLEYYYPDGTLFTSGKTINAVNQEVFPNDLLYSHNTLKQYNRETEKGILAVYFRLFTNEPLFILGVNASKTEIQIAIESFNLEKLIDSWQFDFELKYAVRDRELRIEHLYKAFGQPTRKSTSSDGTNEVNIFYYEKPKHMSYTITNGIVTSYSIID